LISSKCTEKVQDQPWNNLTLLYDLRRSTKTGAFKYKILNFKEHGHGSISAIKGLSNTNDKSTHWVTGGVNKKIFYWRIGDLSTDTTLDSKVLMNEHTSAVSSFHYCAHKDYIYSGGLDGKVFGYNLDGIIQTSFSFKKKIRNIHQIGSSPSTLLVT
jgi:WD40 repeat protein